MRSEKIDQILKKVPMDIRIKVSLQCLFLDLGYRPDNIPEEEIERTCKELVLKFQQWEHDGRPVRL